MLRTVVIENAGHLFVRNDQLMIRQNGSEVRVGSFEDIGWILLEHPQLTMTQAVMSRAASKNTVVIFCGDQYFPVSIATPTEGNYLQGERLRWQLDSTVPRKKSLWKQLIQQKIENQARLLELIGSESEPVAYLKSKVRSGDPDNIEAQAARRYWTLLFGFQFKRDRIGMIPNPWLNYGYAILRSCVVRMLTASGLHPGHGIHHANKYNAFALADDVMEPLRPWVDRIAWSLFHEQSFQTTELNTYLKKELLEVLQHDVQQGTYVRPMAQAIQQLGYEVAMYLGGKIEKITPIKLISLDTERETWDVLEME